MGERIVGQSPRLSVNLATINGAQMTDGEVSATVSVQATGQRVGVIARYSGIREQSFYLGEIIKTATGQSARLVRYINGWLPF